MTLPTNLRPTCLLTLVPHTFWGVTNEVVRTLKLRGYPDQANEFRRAAFLLNQNDDDTDELLHLVTQYVEVN